MKSTKTTISGIGVILATLGNAIAEYTAGGFAGVNVGVLIAGFSTGVGLILAKDFNVTNSPAPVEASKVPPAP
jgi:hypothetical protein